MRAIMLAVAIVLAAEMLEATQAKKSRKSSNPMRAPVSDGLKIYRPLIERPPISPLPLTISTPSSTMEPAMIQHQQVIDAHDTSSSPEFQMTEASSLHIDKGKGVIQSKEEFSASPSLSSSSEYAHSPSMYHPESSSKIPPSTLFERRRMFENAWKKMNVNFHHPPDPHDLFQAIRDMKIPGLDHRNIGQLAGSKIRKSAPKSYLTAYQVVSDQVNSKNSYQKRLQQGLKRRPSKENNNQIKVDENNSKSKSKFSTKLHSRTQRTIDHHAEIVKALEEKKFWTLKSPKDLEIASRDFKFGRHHPKYITGVITRHLNFIGRNKDAKELRRLKDLQMRKKKYESMSREEKKAFLLKVKSKRDDKLDKSQ